MAVATFEDIWQEKKVPSFEDLWKSKSAVLVEPEQLELSVPSDKKSPQFKEFALTKEGSGILAAMSPEVAKRIAAKEQPSRNDLKELGVSGWNAEERTQLSSLFRDALADQERIWPIREEMGAPVRMPGEMIGAGGMAKSVEIADDKRIGFKESAIEEFTRPAKGAQYIPAIGGVVGSAEQLLYLDAGQRIQSGFDYSKPIRPEQLMPGAMGHRPARYTTKEEDQKIIDDLWIRTENQQRGYTFGGMVAKGLLNLPTWMAEFAMTGGLASLGSKAAKEAGVKVMGRYAKTKAGQLALKGMGWTGGAITRATLGLAPRITEKALERQVSVQILGADQEGWATSFAKAWGDITIEAASETAGQAITGVPIKLLNKTKFGSKFLNALRSGWMKATGGKAAMFAKKMATKGGYSNILGEYGEERLGSLLRALTDVDDFGAGKDANVVERLKAAAKQDFDPMNIAVEFTVLSAVPGAQVALGTAGRVLGREAKPAAEVTPEKRTQAIDYVKSILSQEQFATLDEKARAEIGQRMLAEQGVEVTAEELAVTAPTVPITEPTEAVAAKKPAEAVEIPLIAAEAKPEAAVLPEKLPPDTDLQIQENAVAQIPESPKIGTADRAVLDNLKKPITQEEKEILHGMGMTVPEILKGDPAELRKKIAVSNNARRRMGGFFNLPIETPEPAKVRTFFETLYQNVVNRFASIENITNKAKKLGLDIAPGLDPTKRARLYLGLGRKVESMLRDNTFRIDRKGNIVLTGEGLKPILDSYDLNMTKYERSRKQRQKDFNQYLFAQRTILDLQRPAYEGAPRLIVTPEQVAQAKKDLAALKEKLGVKAIVEMERHAQRLYAYQKRILRLLVDGGNMSQKLFDKIVKENPHYIPFDRVLNKDTFAGVPVTKNRFTKARAGIRKIKGTKLEIEKQNPIESVIKNTHRIIEAAERNLVARSVAKLSATLPGDIKPVRIKMYPIRVDPAEILTVVKEFRSKSAKITKEFKKTRTEGGETADVSGPIKKLESVVKEALTSRGFSEGEANSFITQIRKGKPTTEGGESTHTVETIRQVIKETQKIITSEVPIESTIFRPSQFAPKGNVIEYYENGKRRYMEVSPNLYAAMTGLTEEGASIVADILSVPAHWLRVGATITPEFMARNPIRDTYTALMQTSFGFIPFYDSIGAIADIVGKTEVYKDWIRSGAAHSGFVELSRPALKKAYKGLQTTWGRKILSKLNIIADAHDISQILEEATRVAIFKRATRRGLSDVEAGYEAREATVDFARRGAKMGNINKTIAFFNAGIQGFDKTIRNSIAHPYSTAIKGMMLITLPSLVLYLRNRDDEEYKELAQWKKDLFWNFKVNDIWFRVPKPFLYGQIFGSLPERFFEYLDTQDRNALDGLAVSIIESSSPIGLNPIETMIPTGVKPFVENFFNYNLFRERTLVPEHLISGPKPDQYTRYTSETAKQLGEWFNMSPAKIENTIYGLTGGTGGHILGGTDVLINAIKGESSQKRPKGLADIPLVKGFVSRDPSGPSAQSIADFYIETKRITGLRTSWMGKLKKGDNKAADKMLERNPELALGPELVKFQTALSKLSKGIDNIAQGDLSTEDKRAKIKEFDQRRLNLARRANELIKEKM